MRPSFFLACFFLFGLLGRSTNAQVLFASAKTYVSPIPAGGGTPKAAPAAPKKVLVIGKITNPEGPLPGAVVFLTGTKEMAVTNAEGKFEFSVPATAGPLEARVTYGGYADETIVLNPSASESTVSMTNAKVITVSRKQQLKKYLKTAHKQIRREMRKMR